MKKWILFFMIIIPFSAYADPAQFNGLLTDSTDYTCASTGVTPCTTWPIPAAIDWGGTYADPTFRTTTKRVGVATDCLINGGNPSACDTRRIAPNYSKQEAWNSDGSKYILLDSLAWYNLYDNATDTSIRRITDATGLSSDNDVKWSHTDPNLIYYANGLSIKSYNISTHAVTTLYTASCSDGTHSGTRIRNGDEGNQSTDDKYWAVACQWYDGSYWNTISAQVIDIQTPALVAEVPVNTICGGTCSNYSKPVFNWIGMSPSGTYVIINYDELGAAGDFTTRGNGTELFAQDLSYIGKITPNHGHQDVGYDVNGVEVMVGEQEEREETGVQWTLYITKLPDLTKTKLKFPCTYAYSGPGCGVGTFYQNDGHISMRATENVASRGWALFSTYKETTTTGQGWGALELFAVKIDTTATTGGNVVFHRIGRAMSVRNNDYFAEPHAVPNRDFTKVLWASNWNVNGGLVSAYTINLDGNYGQDVTAPVTVSDKAAGRYGTTQTVTLSVGETATTLYCLTLGASCTPVTNYTTPFKWGRNTAQETFCTKSTDTATNAETPWCYKMTKQVRR